MESNNYNNKLRIKYKNFTFIVKYNKTIKEFYIMAKAKTKLFANIKKKITKKHEDAIIDLEEPAIWASSGNYVLNHILSGRFEKGYPAGRITQLFGDSGCLLPHEKIKVYKFKSKLENLD